MYHYFVSFHQAKTGADDMGEFRNRPYVSKKAIKAYGQVLAIQDEIARDNPGYTIAIISFQLLSAQGVK